MTTAVGFLTRPALWPLSHGEWSPADDLIYADDDGYHVVPIGTRVNGASIPRFLWSFIGHPMTTAYIYPAVLHDAQCGARQETPTAVHRRFYDALRTEDVRPMTAWLMYTAVRLFGPTWRMHESR